MRKVFVLLSAAALLAIPAPGAAQAPSLGLKAGVNMASFAGRRIVDADYRAGLSLGASLSIPVSGSFTVQPEVLFSRKGAKRSAYDYDDMPQDGFAAPPVGVYLSEKTSHDYLEIPVLLKLSPAQPGDVVRCEIEGIGVLENPVAAGYGAQRASDTGWRPAHLLEASVTSPPTASDWTVRAGFIYTNTPGHQGTGYDYRQIGVTVGRTF